MFIFPFLGLLNGNHNVYPGHMSRSSNEIWRSHSRTPSIDLRHSRNSSADLNKYFKSEIGLLNNAGPPGMFK